MDAQGPDPAHSLMRVLDPVVVSDDGEGILTCLCKDDFLIVMSLHGSSRGGRKRQEGRRDGSRMMADFPSESFFFSEKQEAR